MSLLGVAAAATVGATLGNAGASLELKYAKSVYQEKIDALEACRARLDTHLEHLEGYQQQIYQFWTGETAEKYFAMVGNQIQKVHDAQNLVAKTKQNWETAISEMDTTQTRISDLTEAAQSAVSSLTSLDS
jgi:uncharacterized protein YukE